MLVINFNTNSITLEYVLIIANCKKRNTVNFYFHHSGYLSSSHFKFLTYTRIFISTSYLFLRCVTIHHLVIPILLFPLSLFFSPSHLLSFSLEGERDIIFLSQLLYLSRFSFSLSSGLEGERDRETVISHVISSPSIFSLSHILSLYIYLFSL